MSATVTPRCWTRPPVGWEPAPVTTAPSTAGARPAPPRRPRAQAGALRLVLLRLGDVGLQHLGDDRLPRPVPDRGRRDAAGADERLSLPRPVHRGRQLVLLRAVGVGAPAGARAADHRRRRRPDGPQAGDAGRASPSSARWRRTGLFFVGDGRWLLGAVLFVVANIAFGAATVVYYSWLPDLAGPDERDAVSSRGWAFGYVGGALLLAVHLGLVLGADVPRPDQGRGGADLPGHRGPVVGRVHRLHASPGCATVRCATPTPCAAHSGFRQLAVTLREMRRLPADAVVPRRLPAVQRRRADGHRALGDRTRPRSWISTRRAHRRDPAWCRWWPSSGALGLGRLAGRYGAKRVVLGSLVAWIGVLVAAYFLQTGCGGPVLRAGRGHRARAGRHAGAVPVAVQPADPRRARRPSTSASTRSATAGTSWLGPLAFGLTYQLTGSYRLAIVSLVIFFVAGVRARWPRCPCAGPSSRPATLPPERL